MFTTKFNGTDVTLIKKQVCYRIHVDQTTGQIMSLFSLEQVCGILIMLIWDGKQTSYTFYRVKHSKRLTDKAKMLISRCLLHPFDEFLFDRPIISGEFGDLSRLDGGISLLKYFKYPS